VITESLSLTDAYLAQRPINPLAEVYLRPKRPFEERLTASAVTGQLWMRRVRPVRRCT